MALYREDFPEGSKVRVVSRSKLDQFSRTWDLHHKLQPEQLDYAGLVFRVAKVSFYHGGDVLYELTGAPGDLA